MTKQKKLRHAEYYDMQEVLDKLYVDSKDSLMTTKLSDMSDNLVNSTSNIIR